MMQRNKVSLEKQIDDRLYQLLVPFEGNWNELEIFAQEVVCLARKNIEAAEKPPQEQVSPVNE